MSKIPELPNGGVDNRKYAAIFLALGLVRGALYAALFGQMDRTKEILDLTSTEKIAKALGYSEDDLAIDWNDHLTRSEINQIEGF